jgi:hypothetical protein
MLKMTCSCHYHHHSVFIAIIDAQLVLNGTSGLDYRSDSGIVRNLNAVGEWKEGITGHDSPFQIKIEGARFMHCLVQGIYPGGLPCAAGAELFIFGQNNGVGFGMLANLLSEEQVFGFPLAWLAIACGFQILGSVCLQVFILI